MEYNNNQMFCSTPSHGDKVKVTRGVSRAFSDFSDCLYGESMDFERFSGIAWGDFFYGHRLRRRRSKKLVPIVSEPAVQAPKPDVTAYDCPDGNIVYEKWTMRQPDGCKSVHGSSRATGAPERYVKVPEAPVRVVEPVFGPCGEFKSPWGVGPAKTKRRRVMARGALGSAELKTPFVCANHADLRAKLKVLRCARAPVMARAQSRELPEDNVMRSVSLDSVAKTVAEMYPACAQAGSLSDMVTALTEAVKTAFQKASRAAREFYEKNTPTVMAVGASLVMLYVSHTYGVSYGALAVTALGVLVGAVNEFKHKDEEHAVFDYDNEFITHFATQGGVGFRIHSDRDSYTVTPAMIRVDPLFASVLANVANLRQASVEVTDEGILVADLHSTYTIILDKKYARHMRGESSTIIMSGIDLAIMVGKLAEKIDNEVALDEDGNLLPPLAQSGQAGVFSLLEPIKGLVYSMAELAGWTDKKSKAAVLSAVGKAAIKYSSDVSTFVTSVFNFAKYVIWGVSIPKTLEERVATWMTSMSHLRTTLASDVRASPALQERCIALGIEGRDLMVHLSAPGASGYRSQMFLDYMRHCVSLETAARNAPTSHTRPVPVMVMFTGPAGVGKSIFCAELAKAAALKYGDKQPYSVLSGQNFPMAGYSGEKVLIIEEMFTPTGQERRDEEAMMVLLVVGSSVVAVEKPIADEKGNVYLRALVIFSTSNEQGRIVAQLSDMNAIDRRIPYKISVRSRNGKRLDDSGPFDETKTVLSATKLPEGSSLRINEEITAAQLLRDIFDTVDRRSAFVSVASSFSAKLFADATAPVIPGASAGSAAVMDSFSVRSLIVTLFLMFLLWCATYVPPPKTWTQRITDYAISRTLSFGRAAVSAHLKSGVVQAVAVIGMAVAGVYVMKRAVTSLFSAGAAPYMRDPKLNDRPVPVVDFQRFSVAQSAAFIPGDVARVLCTMVVFNGRSGEARGEVAHAAFTSQHTVCTSHHAMPSRQSLCNSYVMYEGRQVEGAVFVAYSGGLIAIKAEDLGPGAYDNCGDFVTVQLPRGAPHPSVLPLVQTMRDWVDADRRPFPEVAHLVGHMYFDFDGMVPIYRPKPISVVVPVRDIRRGKVKYQSRTGSYSYDGLRYTADTAGGDSGLLLLSTQSHPVLGMHQANSSSDITQGMGYVMIRDQLSDLLKQMDAGCIVQPNSLVANAQTGEVTSCGRKQPLYRAVNKVPVDRTAYRPSPWAAHLAPTNCHPATQSDTARKFKDAIDTFESAAPHKPGPDDLEKVKEAFKLLYPMPRTKCRRKSLSEVIRDVPANTGAGVPLRDEPGGAQGKEIFLKRNSRGEIIGLREEYLGPFRELERQVVEGVPPLQAYLASQKDELLPNTKDKMRLIYGEPFFLTLLGNMYFGDAMDQMKKLDPDYHCAVGVNRYDRDEWHRVVVKDFPNPANGDSRRNDFRQTHGVLGSFMHHLSEFYDSEHRMARDSIIALVLLSPRVYNCIAYFLSASLASGSFITTIGNSGYTGGIMLASWSIDRKWTVKQAFEDLKLLTYGDDSKAESRTCSKAVVSDAMVTCFGSRFGMEYVPTDDPSNRFLGGDESGCLEVDTIWDIVRWTRSATFDDRHSRVASFLLECYMHGEKFYCEATATLKAAMSLCDSSYCVALPPFSHYEEWASKQAQAQSRVIREEGEYRHNEENLRNFDRDSNTTMTEKDWKDATFWQSRANDMRKLPREPTQDQWGIMAMSLIAVVGAMFRLVPSNPLNLLIILLQAGGEEVIKLAEFRERGYYASLNSVALPEILGKVVTYCYYPHPGVLVGILLSTAMHVIGPLYVRTSKRRFFAATAVHTLWNWFVTPAAAVVGQSLLGVIFYGAYMAGRFLDQRKLPQWEWPWKFGYRPPLDVKTHWSLALSNFFSFGSLYALFLFFWNKPRVHTPTANDEDQTILSSFGKWFFSWYPCKDAEDETCCAFAQSKEIGVSETNVIAPSSGEANIEGEYSSVGAPVGGSITLENSMIVPFIDPVTDPSLRVLANITQTPVTLNSLAVGDVVTVVDVCCALASIPSIATLWNRTSYCVPDFDIKVAVTAGALSYGAWGVFCVCAPLGDKGYSSDGTNIQISLPGVFTEDLAIMDLSESSSVTLKVKWNGPDRMYSHALLTKPGWGVTLFIVNLALGGNVSASTAPVQLNIYASLGDTMFGGRCPYVLRSVGGVIAPTTPIAVSSSSVIYTLAQAQTRQVTREEATKSKTRNTTGKRTVKAAINGVVHAGVKAVADIAEGWLDAGVSYAMSWVGLSKPPDDAAPTTVVPGVAPGNAAGVGLGTANVLSSDQPSDMALQSMQVGMSGANTDDLLMSRPGLLAFQTWSSGSVTGGVLFQTLVTPTAVGVHAPGDELVMHPPPLAVGSMFAAGFSGGVIRYTLIACASSFAAGSLRIVVTPSVPSGVPGPEATSKVVDVAGMTIITIDVPLQMSGRSDYSFRNVLTVFINTPLVSNTMTTATTSCIVHLLVQGIGVKLVGRSGYYMVDEGTVSGAHAQSKRLSDITSGPPSLLVPEFANPESEDPGIPGYSNVLSEIKRAQPWLSVSTFSIDRHNGWAVFPGPYPSLASYSVVLNAGSYYCTTAATPNLLDHLGVAHRGYYGGMCVDVAFRPQASGGPLENSPSPILVSQGGPAERVSPSASNMQVTYTGFIGPDCSMNTSIFVPAVNGFTTVQAPRSERGEFSPTAPTLLADCPAEVWAETCIRPVVFKYATSGTGVAVAEYVARWAADDFAWCAYRLHKRVYVFSSTPQGNVLVSSGDMSRPYRVY